MAVASEAPRIQLQCDCGTSIPLERERVGDSVRCAACGALRVVVRSKVRGPIPPATKAGGLSPEERRELADALRRIKLRRVGRAARHVELYPSWAVFVAGVQFYLAGILAGQNLITVGDARRGRRVRAFAVGAYVALGALFLGLAVLDTPIPRVAGLAALALTPLAFAAYLTSTQHAACSAAREAGAKNAPVLLPLLLGLILAILQAFAVGFLLIRLDGPLG